MAASVMRTTSIANAGHLCKLVDDFALDERGIHVEGEEAAIAAEDTFALECNIDGKLLGGREELGAHGSSREASPLTASSTHAFAGSASGVS
jgi:hypothetical protein